MGGERERERERQRERERSEREGGREGGRESKETLSPRQPETRCTHDMVICCFRSSRGGTRSGVNLPGLSSCAGPWAHTSYPKRGRSQRQYCLELKCSELVPDLITGRCEHSKTMSTGVFATLCSTRIGLKPSLKNSKIAANMFPRSRYCRRIQLCQFG